MAANTRTIEADSLALRFRRVRERSVVLTSGLAPEDTVVQTMPDVSPTKWHLAHTTWFFEEFVLAVFVDGYRRFHAGYDYLFNSYYDQVGPMHLRARRGFITRPTLAEVLEYRERVDAAVTKLLEAPPPGVAERVELGCEHEQQHQELLVTDIKHVLAQNPLAPAWKWSTRMASRAGVRSCMSGADNRGDGLDEGHGDVPQARHPHRAAERQHNHGGARSIEVGERHRRPGFVVRPQQAHVDVLGQHR